jgi:hypothetical protein
MPDLITHTAAAFLVTRRGRFDQYRVFIYLGTILPDVISRPIYILKPELYTYTVGIHTPVFMLFFILLLSEFIIRDIRRIVFWSLALGVGIHLLLDAFQKHLAGGYFWLFPVSWSTYSWGLFWPEITVRLFPIWLLIIVLTEITTRIKRMA